MKIEEHGDYYIEERTMTDPAGEVHQIFDVGYIVEVDGEGIRKTISDRGFRNHAEALKWIESQTE